MITTPGSGTVPLKLKLKLTVKLIQNYDVGKEERERGKSAAIAIA